MTTNDRLKYEHFYGLIERHKALIERLCMRVRQATAIIVPSCDKNVISRYGNTKNK